jgi:hypothetical protein
MRGCQPSKTGEHDDVLAARVASDRAKRRSLTLMSSLAMEWGLTSVRSTSTPSM